MPNHLNFNKILKFFLCIDFNFMPKNKIKVTFLPKINALYTLCIYLS